MGSPFLPTVFWCDAPEAGLIGAVSLFKFRRIKHLVVAAITEFVVPRAAPLDERIRKDGSLTGDRGFESFSLQRRVTCEPVSRGNSPSYVEKPRFSAGVRVGASGTVGRDAQAAATSGLLAVISLSGHIPVPHRR